MLLIMCATVFFAVAASALFMNLKLTSSLLLGGLLGILNYHWLATSVASTIQLGLDGKKSRIRRASRYVLRYFVIAAVLFLAYKANVISIPAALLGMSSFVVAIFVEAFMQMYKDYGTREQ